MAYQHYFPRPSMRGPPERLSPADRTKIVGK